MKVKQVQSTGSFDMSIGGQPTTLYSFEYEFDDNSVGIANHKTQDAPFKAGDEVLVEENGISPRGDRKIKVKKPESGSYAPQNSTQSHQKGGSEVGEQIMRQTCVKAAAEFYAQRGQATENEVIFTAARWYEWCKTGNPVVADNK